MANPYPLRTTKFVKRHYKLVDRKSGKVVLATDSSFEASRFLGSYKIYLFHVVNGHRKFRIHPKYDVYVDGEKIAIANTYQDNNALVVEKAITYFPHNNKKRTLEIVEMKHSKKYKFYELMIRVDDLPPKYFYFSRNNPPTYKTVLKRVKEKLA